MVVEHQQTENKAQGGAKKRARGSKAVVSRRAAKTTGPSEVKRPSGRASSPGASARAATGTTDSRSGKSARIPDAPNWDQRLGFLMHDVSRLRRTVFDSFVRPLGVTRSQWWVIAHLGRHDGMIQTDLAKVLDLGKASLGSLVDRLEVSEFIVRRPDEIDRRAKRVYLTAKGNALIAQIKAPSHELSERMLEGMSPDRRSLLVELLSQVRHNLLAIKVEEGIDESDEAGAE
jgi:MarR family transcriptional regulator for hemolysin